MAENQNNIPHQHHDSAYKLMYSHPKMVEDLLRGFVHRDFVHQLDFSTLEKLGNSYVTDDLRTRSDDIVWRVRFQDQWLYLYLLIEFQSSVDSFMAVRILNYVSLMYQDLIKTKQLPDKKKLPPVLPIVLYNGEAPWNAAQSISELLQPMPDSLKAFQPAQHYWLIDEGRHSAEALEQLENLTAAIIRAELAEDQAKLAKVVANIDLWLRNPAQQALRKDIQTWLIDLLKHRIPDIKVDEVQQLTEIESMLARNWSEKWLAEGKAQGKTEGKLEGKLEGKTEGEILLFQKQLKKRFGELPHWATEKLQTASVEQIETWAENIFEAKSLDEALK